MSEAGAVMDRADGRSGDDPGDGRAGETDAMDRPAGERLAGNSRAGNRRAGNRRAGDRRTQGLVFLAVAGILLLAAVALSIAIGPAKLDFTAVASAVLDGHGLDDPALRRDWLILFDIRLPRTIMGILVGSGLALAGALMQGLFRNPLADPTLLGVSTGAGLAAVSVIYVAGGGFVLSPLASTTFALPVAAFGGSLVATVLLYALATRDGRTSVATMLLGGIALSAFLASGIGVFVFVSDDNQLRDFNFWMLGSLGGATWEKAGAAAPFVLGATLGALFLSRGLNALLLGEAEAFHMGIPVQSVKTAIVVAVSAAAGASVAAAGSIGFVGIVVPHLIRILIGPDHRFLVPLSAILGGALILAADVVSRVAVAPAELPIGIVMAFIGAPVFLAILLKRRDHLAI